jgi:general nucleoside transport system ATP-binding protein
MPPVLELRGITKAFPGVLANDHIDLTLEQGEIHCLLGENGAGKTTLMNILYGLYKPDEGEILVRGEKVEIHGPNDAIARGIGMVHQHFMLVPVMTVTENVMLGVETTRGGVLLNHEEVARRIEQVGKDHGLEVPQRRTSRTCRSGAAARRDHQSALPQRRYPDPRRANGRPDAPGSGRPVQDPAFADR